MLELIDFFKDKTSTTDLYLTKEQEEIVYQYLYKKGGVNKNNKNNTNLNCYYWDFRIESFFQDANLYIYIGFVEHPCVKKMLMVDEIAFFIRKSDYLQWVLDYKLSKL